MKNINDLSEQEQIKLVQKDTYDIRFIKSPSLEVQLAAVQKNGHAIIYIRNPSENVQLAAVKNTPYAIQLISNPSEVVQQATVKENVRAIGYIENPSPQIFVKRKRDIMIYILNQIKNGDYHNLNPILKYLDKYAVKWSELDIIKASLTADKLIK